MILGRLALQSRRADELVARLPSRSSAFAKPARHLQQIQVARLARMGEDERYALDTAQLHSLKRQLFTRVAGVDSRMEEA